MNSAPPALRTLAFGDLERTIWGAGWISADPAGAMLTLLLGDDSGRTFVGTERLSAGGESDEWRVGGDRSAVVVSPVGDPVAVHDTQDRVEGFDQLCRVSGRFALDGGEHTIDCLGLRTSWSSALDLERFESIRAVSSWFDPDEGLALTAFRSRKAKGHDGDMMTAAVIGPDGSSAVQDPRLSTTYETEGWPVRAGLELWLPSEESDERQYPRRASGEATGERAQATIGQLDVRAEPFRWHSRGRNGAGMYILARRR
jgi:hypothetical protein